MSKIKGLRENVSCAIMLTVIVQYNKIINCDCVRNESFFIKKGTGSEKGAPDEVDN
ncbi:hypothetical protein [Thermincola ferriacetica]|uniref:hypothetical protein n=1 Tax=Thermincola ferriacetica TaxID=281456 RepID=UPI001364CEBB|nr:hypothetical protein [Thermincola ferriacetica]